MRTAEEGREVFAKVERISAPLSPSDPHAWKDVGKLTRRWKRRTESSGLRPSHLVCFDRVEVLWVDDGEHRLGSPTAEERKRRSRR